MQHGYRWCIEIFFSYHKFLQPSAIRMLRERRPERGEFLTKRMKTLIHDLTESCFSLRTGSHTPPPPPPPPKDETEETGRLRKPDTNRVP